jgi:hypothetical protein
MRSRAASFWAGVMSGQATPSTRTVPSVGCSKPAAIRPSVDFPQPDSPTRPTTSPGWTARLTESTAWVTGPGRLSRSWRSARSNQPGAPRSPKRWLTWSSATSGATAAAGPGEVD